MITKVAMILGSAALTSYGVICLAVWVTEQVIVKAVTGG